MLGKLQLRRMLESERITQIFAEGEPIYCKDSKLRYTGDGLTPGGIPDFDVTALDGQILTFNNIGIKENDSIVIEHEQGVLPKQVIIEELENKEFSVFKETFQYFTFNNVEKNKNGNLELKKTDLPIKPICSIDNLADNSFEMEFGTSVYSAAYLQYTRKNKFKKVDDTVQILQENIYKATVGNCMLSLQNNFYINVERHIMENQYATAEARVYRRYVATFNILDYNFNSIYLGELDIGVGNRNNFFKNFGNYSPSYPSWNTNIIIVFDIKDNKLFAFDNTKSNCEFKIFDLSSGKLIYLNDNINKIFNNIAFISGFKITSDDNYLISYVDLNNNEFFLKTDSNFKVLITLHENVNNVYNITKFYELSDSSYLASFFPTKILHIKTNNSVELIENNFVTSGNNSGSWLQEILTDTKRFLVVWKMENNTYSEKYIKIYEWDGTVFNLLVTKDVTFITSSSADRPIPSIIWYKDGINWFAEIANAMTSTTSSTTAIWKFPLKSDIVVGDFASSALTATTTHWNNSIIFLTRNLYANELSGYGIKTNFINVENWKNLKDIRLPLYLQDKTATIEFLGNDGTSSLTTYNTPISLENLYDNVKEINAKCEIDISIYTTDVITLSLDDGETTTPITPELTCLNNDDLTGNLICNAINYLQHEKIAYATYSAATVTVYLKDGYGVTPNGVWNVTDGTNVTNFDSGRDSILQDVKKQTGDKKFKYKINLSSDVNNITPEVGTMQFIYESVVNKTLKSKNYSLIEYVADDNKIQIDNNTNDPILVRVSCLF